MGFGSPLLFFSVAPEDKDTGENGGEEECEPGTGGDFDKGGREIYTVESCEDEEEDEDDENVYAPDYYGHEGDHAGCYEGYEDYADSVGISEASCLVMLETYF